MICDDRVVNLKMQGRPNGILKPPANIHNSNARTTKTKTTRKRSQTTDRGPRGVAPGLRRRRAAVLESYLVSVIVIRPEKKKKKKNKIKKKKKINKKK